MISGRNELLKVTGCGMSIAAGIGAVWNPLAAIGATVGTLVVGLAVLFPVRVGKFFLAALGVALIGYAFLNKGFAYLGAPPLFIGEVILGLGLVAAAVSGNLWAAARSPITWLLVLFALWGAARTIPFIRTYRLEALRDAVVWGYAAFALILPVILLRSGFLISIPERYRRLLPWFLVWIPVGNLLGRFASYYIPNVPGTDVPLLYLKTGDAAVHLAGAAAFLSLGLYQLSLQQEKIPLWIKEWLWWMCWLVALLVVSTTRGGIVSVLAAALVVLALRPLSRWGKVTLIGLVLTTIFFAFNLEIDINDWQGRKISPQQISERVQTIFMKSSQDEGLEGTREWRLNWWRDIVNYTVYGKYFWTGKGFGVNLAEDDGYQGQWEALRSPHNGHMTILARMGVPGMILWILLQGTFAVSLLRAYFIARGTRQEWWARVNLWVLAYWAAFIVNGAFDVFLEGPQGGIWFWCLFGFGITILEAQRQQSKKSTISVNGTRQPLLVS